MRIIILNHLVALFIIHADIYSQDYNSIFDENIHDLEILNERSAICYTYGSGKIYKTFSNGNDWQLIYQFDSIYFEQIQFLDENNGWIIGSPGHVYKTTDGGKSWDRSILEGKLENSLLYGMYFKSVDTGYIAAIQRSTNGIITHILQTKNAGDSWETFLQVKELIIDLNFINGSLFASGNHVILQIDPYKKEFNFCFKDTSKMVGQIREIGLLNGNIIGVSSNGYFIKCDPKQGSFKLISKSRLRSLLVIDDKMVVCSGDLNNGKSNLFYSNDFGSSWSAIRCSDSDIHRIKLQGSELWLVGKSGLNFKIKLERYLVGIN